MNLYQNAFFIDVLIVFVIMHILRVECKKFFYIHLYSFKLGTLSLSTLELSIYFIVNCLF